VGRPDDIAADDDLVDLETTVLDGLDAADGADAPAGTVALDAARRRASDDIAGLLK
jgi:hypothetical protein